MIRDNEIYCPVCQRVLVAVNEDEFMSGEHDGRIFIHDDIDHEESDIDALMYGIN